MQTSINLEGKLKSEHIQAKVLQLLLIILKMLPIETEVAEAKLETVFRILLLAATEQKTINRICEDYTDTPSGVTVRNTLKLIFSDMKLLEQFLNRILRATIKRKMIRGNPCVCADLVLIEYYGKEEKDPNEIRKGERKNGTNQFHGYATVYLRVRDQRYTLAITYVWAHDTMLQVLQRLNKQILRFGLKPSLWLLDGGFYSVGVIKWCQQYNKPYLMPVPMKGRSLKHPKGPTSTYVFQTYTKSESVQYTLSNHDRKKSVTTDVTVVVTYPQGRGKDIELDIYAYAHFNLNMRPRAIHDLYKKRFSIESSYRQMNQARARTSSKSPALRYLMVGVALILRNVWISIHFHVLYEKRPGPGGRKTNLSRLTFITLLSWLRDAITQIFPLNTQLDVPDPSRLNFLPNI